ncbi:MAG: DUF1822 family protein [Cyanobacteria bacterium J06633_8]
MARVNRNEISLYEEARDGLISLFQQTVQVFIGLLLLLILTKGNPPGFLVGFSFIAGIIFVAFRENKRFTKFIARKSSDLSQEIIFSETTTAIESDVPEESLVNLNNWLQGTINASAWKTVDVLERAFGAKLVVVRSDIKRGKVINFETDVGKQTVILLIALSREANQTIKVLIQVYPSGGEVFLPEGLKFTVLEASGEPVIDVEGKVIEAEAKTNSYYIQRRITATSGKKFSIKISLENINVIQEFIV